jgi:alkylresorcinol/alkylpyrone synthase
LRLHKTASRQRGAGIPMTAVRRASREADAPRVVATATATPPHVVGADDTRRYLRQVFGPSYPHFARIERMVEQTAIETRHLALPPEDLIARRDLEASNALYVDTARDLARTAAGAALARADIAPEAIDAVVAVSCTGYAIPSLDVHVVNDLGLRRDTRRLPITELGCGGGTAGLALAGELVRARPGSTVLLVSVELCSNTFQPDDHSWENVIAAMLFGDGAAAAVITDRPREPGPALLASRSHLFPDTLDYMGYVLKATGFHLVMSPRVPEMVKTEYRPLLTRFLAEHELRQHDLGFYVLHPGGARILQYYEEHVGVPAEWLAYSATDMRRHGNMSSASVLFVLDEIFRDGRPRAGELGLLGSLGPGFCAELLLLRWED